MIAQLWRANKGLVWVKMEGGRQSALKKLFLGGDLALTSKSLTAYYFSPQSGQMLRCSSKEVRNLSLENIWLGT